MDISFVILTWNSKAHITKCVESIVASIRDGYRYEIFIIDNGSIDGTVNLLKQFEKKYDNIVKPIYLDINTGTTYSRNMALRKCAGKYIVVLDSDVEIYDSTIPNLVAELEKDAAVGMVVPKLLYGSGLLQKSTDSFPTIWRKFARYFFLKSMEKRQQSQAGIDGTVDVDYAISAFWMMRSEILGAVGLLDEKIFYAPEDVDYCLRIWKAGYGIKYVPKAYATHYAQEISRGFKINKATIQHVKGLIYFFRKHGYIFTKPDFY